MIHVPKNEIKSEFKNQNEQLNYMLKRKVQSCWIIPSTPTNDL